MLTINFYPDSDIVDFSKDIEEYQNIWNEDGNKIVETWEKLTGLEFQETFINAVIIDRISQSHPLSLRFNYKTNQKKSVLVHELGHRILHKRGIKKIKLSSLLNHKHLYLKLPNVILELYGRDFLEETIEFEKNLSSDYKEAWDWALKFSTEERNNILNQVLKGDLSVLEK